MGATNNATYLLVVGSVEDLEAVRGDPVVEKVKASGLQCRAPGSRGYEPRVCMRARVCTHGAARDFTTLTRLAFTRRTGSTGSS